MVRVHPWIVSHTEGEERRRAIRPLAFLRSLEKGKEPMQCHEVDCKIIVDDAHWVAHQLKWITEGNKEISY